MHTVVIRRDRHEQHPFLASALYRAFEQSKDAALKKMNIAARCATCCHG